MPKVVDKKEKREKILEAAIPVFAKKGIVATKMVDIADAAEIGKGTIYEYFKSKDEIFIAAFYYVMKKAENIIARRMSSVDDPLEKLKFLFDAWKEIFSSEFRNHLEIMIDFWAEGIRNKDKKATFSLKKIYDENRKMIKDILDECVAKGKIYPVNTKIVASVILGALDGEMVQWITDPKLFTIEESFDVTAEIILTGLKKERAKNDIAQKKRRPT
ncbi:MAG: TetR/AcrR family transcriptional regulator [Candidatus Aminicenantaceae bacterium]